MRYYRLNPVPLVTLLTHLVGWIQTVETYGSGVIDFTVCRGGSE